MLKYIVKRVLWLIPIVIGVSFIIFSIMYLKPGNPAQLILGSEATQEAIDQLSEEMGLNDPFFVQYFNYMKGLVHGDLGTSYRNGNSVSAEIAARFPVTLCLATFSMLLVCMIGIPIGVLSAVKQYSVLDMVSVVLALILASMPSFWIGLMLMLLFSVQLQWLPATGADSVVNYILPCVTLAAVNLAVVTRMTRSTMLEVVRQDYVRTARAKGQTELKVITRHALKNALLPILTVVGIEMCGYIGGSVLVESVFALPGIGKYVLDSVSFKDKPVVLGGVILICFCCNIITFVVDLLYGFVDPRIKATYGAKKKHRAIVQAKREAIQMGKGDAKNG